MSGLRVWGVEYFGAGIKVKGLRVELSRDFFLRTAITLGFAENCDRTHVASSTDLTPSFSCELFLPYCSFRMTVCAPIPRWVLSPVCITCFLVPFSCFISTTPCLFSAVLVASRPYLGWLFPVGDPLSSSSFALGSAFCLPPPSSA